MRKNWVRWVAMAVTLSGVLLIAIAAYTVNVILLVTGIVVIVVSLFLTFFMLIFQLFRMDKQLDLEAIKQAGLTIVKCEKCHKMNVLEDQFCIHCGEKLGVHDE